MKQKNTPAGGRPGRGESGESNHAQYTSLWFRLQAIEGHLLLILIFVERVVREVCR